MADIHLIATLRPAKGKEHQLREILCQTVDHVTSVEKGCLTFLLTECRDPENVVEFKVIERWTNVEALEQHHRRDWLQQMYRTFQSQDLLESSEQIDHLTLVAGFASR